MKARVQWLDGRAFVGETGSGHAVVMDGAPDSGGRNIGIRPMEMMLLGLGGCTAGDTCPAAASCAGAVALFSRQALGPLLCC